MKAYRVELVIIDFDKIGEDGIKNTLENSRYPNRCISPHVLDIEEKDIGEWTDDHPLNKISTMDVECDRLFHPERDPNLCAGCGMIFYQCLCSHE